jgi:hypothetical protein
VAATGETSTSSASESTHREEAGSSSDESSSREDGSETDTDSSTGVPDLDETWPECDPFDAASCPAGEKCMPYDMIFDGEWESWHCGDQQGLAGELESCQLIHGGSGSRSDTCTPGLLCSDASEDSEGWCAAICDDQHPCDPSQACLPAPEGFFSWCRPTCDPLADPSECPLPELACSFGLETEFVCTSPITVEGQQGESCLFATECAAGLTCLSGAVVGSEVCGAHAACCTELCSITSPACPPVAPTCIAVFPQDAEPGFEDLGYCGS